MLAGEEGCNMCVGEGKDGEREEIREQREETRERRSPGERIWPGGMGAEGVVWGQGRVQGWA